MDTLFDVLKVSDVQKLAVSRYQAWYTREPGAVTCPLTDTCSPPVFG